METGKKTENYYAKKIEKVEDLKHFPFSNFKEFKNAVADRKILDIPIQMDMARKWMTETRVSPEFWRWVSYILLLVPYVVILFYLVAAFILPNYWLILFALLALIVTFTGSPMARRMLPFHYLFILGFVIAWVVTGSFPDIVYWLPLLLIYLSLNQLYKGSAGIAREATLNDEKILCLFWKWHWMDLVLADGRRFSQRWGEVDGQMTYHKDIEKEWKEYYEKYQKPGSRTTSDKKSTTKK